MGGLATIARQAGHKSKRLRCQCLSAHEQPARGPGIDLIEGYGAEQISLKPDLWVIGNVVTRGTPLMEEILDRGERYISGPQWLAESILQTKWVLAIAGTHGKTTTSAMLAWILEATGKHPGFLVGACHRTSEFPRA